MVKMPGHSLLESLCETGVTTPLLAGSDEEA